MSAVQYPFIDIAVHPRVRDRFASGEAIVLFSSDMQAAIWANGRGAALFGFASIYDLLEAGPKRSDIAFRQIEAAARSLARAGDLRHLTMRIGSGFQRLPVQGTCELIDLHGGTAVLFSAPVGRSGLSPDACATRMIEGFDDPDTHVAVIDDRGEVLAASPQFQGLHLTAQTMRMLTTMAKADPGRVVKRQVPTARGYLPAALARISDDPSLSLLFTVDTAAADRPQADPALEQTTDTKAEAFEEALPEPQDFAEAAPPTYDDAIDAVSAIEDAPDLPDEESFSQEMPEEPAEDTAEEPEGFTFQRDGRPTRFVWKIDAEGRFSEVSGEFAEAVGPLAASINGMAFRDIAALFHLDPDGKIGDLLSKRDTWSGKTIWWPAQGTSLVVPVDLAALPTYTRNREFDGFRGFGIVRSGDAVEDPNAIGLTLGSTLQQEAMEPTPAETSLTEADEDQAFVPAEEIPAEDYGWQDVAEEPETGTASPREADAGQIPLLSGRQVPSLLDWPTIEPAAVAISETPGRRRSDRIIGLEEQRSRSDGLSPHEQAAFREIARRLDHVAHASDEAQAAEPAGELLPEEHSPAPVVESIPEAQEASFPPAFEAQAQAFAEYANEAFEEPEPLVTPRLTDPVEAETDLPDRELLNRMIPLRERTSLSSEIVDQMPVALLVHSGDVLIHANPEFLRLTGYRSMAELADTGGLDALLQRQDLDPNATDAGGMAIVRADDAIVPVTARLQSIDWEDRTALMLALMPSTGPDNARKPEAEVPARTAPPADQLAKLQVEAEELRAILETATDGVVLIGADGDIRSLNRSASALFNYDNDEAFGKPFVTLFAHESQRAVLDYLDGLKGRGVASVLNDGREVIGREASGGFLPLFMTIGRLTSSNGYCAVIRDITQWKRTEEELRTAKRTAETANAHKSEFLAHVSHEIRTPLNAIIGFADMMATERFGPIGHPRYVEYANDIGRSGRHVLDIVNDLLDISKIEAGEMDLDFKPVELNETISEAVSLVQPQANGQRVIIRTALSHSVPSVIADLRSVKQIVINILSNAIRFTPSGGQIVVSTAYEPNGSVILRVRDTGIGMSEPELELAMKPFRQVPGTTRQRGDGTGLGLPLTKAMVDANRALFSIKSAPNEGTLVEVTFPSSRVLAN